MKKLEGDSKMTNWFALISEEMMLYKESFSDVVSSTLQEKDLFNEFEVGFGPSPSGVEFTVWTRNRVYFPLIDQGLEGVGSVSRNPDGKKTAHIGHW